MVTAAHARVLYWPPRTILATNSCTVGSDLITLNGSPVSHAITNHGNRTIIDATPTIPGLPNTVVTNGFTLTSPSLYIWMDNVQALAQSEGGNVEGFSGYCGKTYSTALVAVPSGALSTVSRWFGDDPGRGYYTTVASYNFADLAWPVPAASVSDSTIGFSFA